jgi:hypothetical protein
MSAMMADIPPDFDSDELVSSENESAINPYLNFGQKKWRRCLPLLRKIALIDRK